MLDAKFFTTEIAALEKKRAEMIAGLQKIDGAIAFARHLLSKVESDEPQGMPVNRLSGCESNGTPAG